MLVDVLCCQIFQGWVAPNSNPCKNALVPIWKRYQIMFYQFRVQFSRHSFKQQSGFSMDSPFFLIAAGIVMDNFEKKCIDSLPFQVPFYFRYVDNILTAVAINEFDTIKKTLNSYNHKIQITIEEESEKNLFF